MLPRECQSTLREALPNSTTASTFRAASAGKSWTFRHCRDTETTTASLPPKKMHSATRSNSSRFGGMTANILCHASSTWTTRHRLRGGVLKGARCICPYAAAELLPLPLGLATLAEAPSPTSTRTTTTLPRLALATCSAWSSP